MDLLAVINSAPSWTGIQPDQALHRQRRGFPCQPITRLCLPHVTIAYRRGDLFLAHQYRGQADTPNGAAVILGYVRLADRPHLSDPVQIGAAILTGWRQRSTDFFARLEGSFALALYDAADNRFVVASDSVSSRTLWLCSAG